MSLLGTSHFRDRLEKTRYKAKKRQTRDGARDNQKRRRSLSLDESTRASRGRGLLLRAPLFFRFASPSCVLHPQVSYSSPTLLGFGTSPLTLRLLPIAHVHNPPFPPPLHVQTLIPPTLSPTSVLASFNSRFGYIVWSSIILGRCRRLELEENRIRGNLLWAFGLSRILSLRSFHRIHEP